MRITINGKEITAPDGSSIQVGVAVHDLHRVGEASCLACPRLCPI